MQKVCLIADGTAELAAAFTKEGYTVLALRGDPELWQMPEGVHAVDVLVCGAMLPCNEDGAGVKHLPDAKAFERALDDAVILPMRQLEKTLPLMENGEKRIAFMTSVRASINLCADVDNYPAHMAEAAKHMRLAVLQQELRERGYTLRLYDPGTLRDAPALATAILRNRFENGNELQRAAAQRLTMQNAQGREYPW